MNDQGLSVFVDCVSNYFNTLSNHRAKIGTPFLTQNVNDYLSEFTGIIGISGVEKGSVFFSCPKKVLEVLLAELGVSQSDDERLMDLVGEVSNTLAGNARREFGDQFMLSVPVVIKGNSEQVKVANVAQIYVIPVLWRNMTANLVINFE